MTAIPATPPQTDTMPSTPYITPETLWNTGHLIALATKTQVRRSNDSKRHKQPAISWSKNPNDYKGFYDEEIGSGIQCDYIPDLDLWLNVIDLDKPKNKEHIPLKDLKYVCEDHFKKTYSAKTPSGGVHIYLLSRQKPKKPPKIVNKINIDYQANKGDGKGHYVVANYRYSRDGKKKQYYNKMKESPDHIKVLEKNNPVDVLNDIIEKCYKNGYILTDADERNLQFINILKPKITEGNRQNMAGAIAGYLRKHCGYNKEATLQIFEKLFNEDLQERNTYVESTYKKDLKDINGITFLKDNLPPNVFNELETWRNEQGNDWKSQIIHKLSKAKEPTSKLLSNFVNSQLELYANLDTYKYYQREETGSIHEINEKRIVELCNDEFGVNTISRKRCYEVLKFVTNPIKKDYNLIEFSNGMLNTANMEFTPNKEKFTKTPKLSLPFNYNNTAQGGKIEEIINQILDNPKYPDDKELWMRAVGHAFFSTNRMGKLTITVGSPGTGKSTLNTILKGIFNYSELPTHVINANERFTLYGLVDKDVNIDDDINNGMLKSIGHLNTITTGNGLEVEIKGENNTIQAENPQIPRLFASGNSLPPVLGDGFDRRLLYIHTENKISYDKRDDNLQNDILQGKYDKDLEWFVYTAINSYYDKKDEPITSEQTEKQMKEEYEFKSYPLLKGVELLFIEDYKHEGTLPVNKVNQYLKTWSLKSFKNGKISKEHKKPSNTQIKKAMDKAGYNQKYKKVEDEYGNINSMRVYEDIKKTKNFNMELGKIDD